MTDACASRYASTGSIATVTVCQVRGGRPLRMVVVAPDTETGHRGPGATVIREAGHEPGDERSLARDVARSGQEVRGPPSRVRVDEARRLSGPPIGDAAQRVGHDGVPDRGGAGDAGGSAHRGVVGVADPGCRRELRRPADGEVVLKVL